VIKQTTVPPGATKKTGERVVLKKMGSNDSSKSTPIEQHKSLPARDYYEKKKADKR
jgi:hypothetical protein